MRRACDLYDRIAEPENLRLAFWKASRGKRHRPDVVRFRARLGEELARLHRGLAAEAVEVGDYRYFTVRDPKERLICAAAFPERVLHHAILNVCEPVFEGYQLHASYACRKGKGVHAAVERVRAYTATRRWYLKLDVRKYFDSIDQGVLLDLLARRFKDARLLALFRRLVGSYQSSPGRGVPIGNLTSQYFANHYLAALDHFVKEDLRVRAYVRYMDDLLLWSDEREELKVWHRAVRQFAGERLGLELKPAVLNRCALGLGALGYRVYPGMVRLNRRSRRRFTAKLRACEAALEEGRITEKEAALRAEPLVAFVRHAASLGLRRQRLGLRPRLEPGASGRKLEQRREERPGGEPQQQQPVEPEQQQWRENGTLSICVLRIGSRGSLRRCQEGDEGTGKLWSPFRWPKHPSQRESFLSSPQLPWSQRFTAGEN